jgi:hypothetical protein
MLTRNIIVKKSQKYPEATTQSPYQSVNQAFDPEELVVVDQDDCFLIP